MEEVDEMGYMETIIQLSCFAPTSALKHHLPAPNPELIAQDIEENWVDLGFRKLNRKALEEYARRVASELLEGGDC